MKKMTFTVLAATACLLSSCVVTTDGTDSYGLDSSPGAVATPTIDLNQADDAATVRFPNGREVLFAPDGSMIKWTPSCTPAEKAAARRAYKAAVTEKNATEADFRDV